MVQFAEKYMFSFGHVTFALAEGNHKGGMLSRVEYMKMQLRSKK